MPQVDENPCVARESHGGFATLRSTQAKEIKAAKRKRDQQEEDDNGMDLSNIITGKRRRADISYAAPLEENNVDEVDDDEEAEFV